MKGRVFILVEASHKMKEVGSALAKSNIVQCFSNKRALFVSYMRIYADPR